MNSYERTLVASQFGVAVEQVERDHLISHLLAFLSENFGDRIHFIGGTALARTHLSAGRLSEDIDLIAIDDRKAVAADIDATLPRARTRTHGRLTLDPMLSTVPSTRGAIIRAASGLTVRLQLLSSHNSVVCPTERRVLFQRYSDAPAAQLLVPTLPAFAASKTSTWTNRRAPRDLWDLCALDGIGAFDSADVDLFCRYGPTNQPPAPHMFTTAPSEDEWHAQLAGQTRITVSAKNALTVVRDAWAAAVNNAQGHPTPHKSGE